MEQVNQTYDQPETSKINRLLERLFKLSAHNTTPRTEMMAGLTTFVTMSYIMFLNPIIMSKTGMPFDGLFLATCIGAAIATILMGLYANWPVGLAPTPSPPATRKGSRVGSTPLVNTVVPVPVPPDRDSLMLLV